jgi:hypothetical protein
VVVTHELPQLYAIADNAIFLDADSHTMIAQGNPKNLATDLRTDPKVREFLFRGSPDKTQIDPEISPASARVGRTELNTMGDGAMCDPNQVQSEVRSSADSHY